jgi:hypothetical protein
MDDSRLGGFNAQIEQLVSKIDALSGTSGGDVSCARLDDLRAARDQLVSVMNKKFAFILAQLDVEAGNQVASNGDLPTTSAATDASAPLPLTPKASNPPAPAPGDHATPGKQASPDDQADAAWAANVKRALSQSNTKTADTASANTQPAPQAPARSQSQPQPLAPLPLRPEAPPPDEHMAALTPLPGPDAAQQLAPGADLYTSKEISEAGEGLFGTLSAELAGVIHYAFKNFGEPNGYIVGDEGGGAFLAGLRYGSGQLHARVNGSDIGPTQIFWEGPSVGLDVGATGSKSLFLVYNLNDSSKLYKRFAGVDGSAYALGGFGLTVLKNGRTIIVPIRTGIGVRLGASLAYLKFTERASWNPF